jgi:hypothetical protein
VLADQLSSLLACPLLLCPPVALRHCCPLPCFIRRPDSDYYILIVLDSKERAVIDNFYDAVMEVLLSSGKLISLKIFDLPEFKRLKSIPTPFMQNILEEGIKIGI